MVLVAHVGLIPHAKLASVLGNAGVDLFFVLSGFLITRLLLNERAKQAPLRFFLIRRSLRIFPIFYLTLLVTAVVNPDDPLLLPAAVYLSNFFGALEPAPTLLQRTWSLCVEEHFYLIWPLIVYLLPRRLSESAAVAIVVAAAAAMLATAWAFQDERLWLLLKQGSCYRFCSLGLGGLIAYRETALRTPGRARTVALAAAAGAAALFLLGGLRTVSGSIVVAPYDMVAELLFLAATSTLVVLIAIGTGPRVATPVRLLAARPLCYLGRISYGVYLYHGLLFVWLIDPDDPAPVRSGWAFVAVAASLAVASVSFHLLERPILRYGNRFRVHDAPPPKPLERLSGPGL